MWNNAANHPDAETARRLSIELALAQQTAAANARPVAFGAPPFGYDAAQLAMQSLQGHPTGVHPVAAVAAAAAAAVNTSRPLAYQAPPTSVESSDVDPAQPAAPPARGKPEAVAAQLSSISRVQEKMDELKTEVEAKEVAAVTAKPVDEENDEPTDVVAVAADDDDKEEEKVEKAVVVEEKSPAAATKKRKRSPVPKKSNKSHKSFPTMNDPVQPITAAEYENLKSMMIQFCRVPLLAEFSRPVSLLHPELMAAYSKIVHHPMDLGKVCRKIRRKDYTCLRDVRLDAWRIFSNCVRYHSHSSNKDAVPSFVSIALHLRDYFNDLWQEFMMPSDPPHVPSKSSKSPPYVHILEAMQKRKADRKQRVIVSGLSLMTGKSLSRSAETLNAFIENGGCVDRLDTERIWGEGSPYEDEKEMDAVVENLVEMKKRLAVAQQEDQGYGVDELERDVRQCYANCLENNTELRGMVGNRLDRFIGKIIVPIHEATCRGVSQSSIWGCMAAAVWARESSKKPFWPALVLGILAPPDQKEDWHFALTERNEKRLPEKLRSQLVAGKRKSEHAIKRQTQGHGDPQSFFLVEFMGTHEFIWVRESDIVENFDPSEDPNEQQSASGSKKKKSTRNAFDKVLGSKTYSSAIEEGKWAMEEFDLQFEDLTKEDPAEGEEGEDMNYSYSLLSQSDDEADDVESDSDTDVEENNELLATDGLINFATFGRKKAKKKAQDIKKQKVDAERKQKAKQKADEMNKMKDIKKQEKDLEKRRKKRAREREKALKANESKVKKRRLSDADDLKKSPSGRRQLIAGKQERATAIVNGYLKRTMEKGEYKTLCLGASIGEGVLTIPGSMIDSAGIVGLALGFRAAAGEIPMPSESGDQVSNVKRWEVIEKKIAKTKKGKDRETLLAKQIELLEKEIARLKSHTTKRLNLIEEAKIQRKKMLEKIDLEDDNARQNPFKAKKKPTPSDTKVKEEDSANEESAPNESNAEPAASDSIKAEEVESTKVDETSGDTEMADVESADEEVAEPVKSSDSKEPSEESTQPREESQELEPVTSTAEE